MCIPGFTMVNSFITDGQSYSLQHSNLSIYRKYSFEAVLQRICPIIAIIKISFQKKFKWFSRKMLRVIRFLLLNGNSTDIFICSLLWIVSVVKETVLYCQIISYNTIIFLCIFVGQKFSLVQRWIISHQKLLISD